MPKPDQENEEVPSSSAPLSFSSQDPPLTSPLLPAKTTNVKPKKPPTVTPRRFNKFFSPRNFLADQNVSTAASRQLREITNGSLNQQSSRHVADMSFEDLPTSRPNKRQKTNLHAETSESSSSPLCSSPCPQYSSPARFLNDTDPVQDYSPRYWKPQPNFPQPIKKSIVRHILPGSSWLPDCKFHTASFCSTPNDVFRFSPLDVPFSIAACNTNSLVAIGDEDGRIRVLESEKDAKPPFRSVHVQFKPHSNAVMDLVFSSDDLKLGSASGDQNVTIIDMPTQTNLAVLRPHSSSVKQIAFQPGNDNVVTTCSRDGSIAIFDIRSFDSRGPRLNSGFGSERRDERCHKNYLNYIVAAHAQDYASLARRSKRPAEPSTPSRGPPAVTSLAFLPHRPYHFLTATDSHSCISLWDMRFSYARSSSRRNSPDPMPLSQTLPVPSHTCYRSYGISGLSLSTDGARLYSLCRDSTLYAYSTNHIMLGETKNDAPKWIHAPSRTPSEGASPLYGLRHNRFHATSFYIRCAIRKAQGPHSELLAVGSGNECPVLFPTDERYLTPSRHWVGKPFAGSETKSPEALTSSETTPSSSFEQRKPRSKQPKNEHLQIFDVGTPLLYAHSREVTGVAWTTNGELVTISDDYTARCWRESAKKARKMRGRDVVNTDVESGGWARLKMSEDEWDEDDWE